VIASGVWPFAHGTIRQNVQILSWFSQTYLLHYVLTSPFPTCCSPPKQPSSCGGVFLHWGMYAFLPWHGRQPCIPLKLE